MSRDMERDLTVNLQQRAGELLERHLRVAQQVLEPAEFATMLVQFAVSMNLTCAATIAGLTDNEADAASAFDFMLSSIARFSVGDRQRALSEVATKRAAR